MILFRCFALTLAFIATAHIASAVIIDDFSQGALFIETTNYPGQTIYQSGLNASDVIGGARSVYVAGATAEIDTSAGQFLLTTDPSANGYFSLGYGTTTPLGVDLTTDGSDRFLINISALTPGRSRGPIAFEVETSGSWFIYRLDNDLLALNGPGTLVIPFSNFTGANMADVQAIEIGAVRFESDSQIGIAAITTAPEPQPFVLLTALGILSFVSKRVWKHIKSH